MTSRYHGNLQHLTARVLIAVALVVCAPAVLRADDVADASRAYYDSAVRHVEAGALRAAVIELKNALQRNPDHVEARVLLGEVYLRLADGASAEKELRAALRIGEDRERVLVALGQALLLQGRFEDLLGEIPAEGLADERGLEALLLRGEAQTRLARHEAARQSYEMAVALRPEDPRGYLGLGRLSLTMGDYAAAEAKAAEALRRQTGLAEARLLLAEARRQGGAAEEAASLFGEVLGAADLSAGERLRALLGRASALIALGRDAAAEDDLDALRDLAPATPLAAYLQAGIEFRRRDLAAARNTLERAAPALAEFPPAQLLFAVVHFDSAEFETARVWAVRYLAGQPDSLEARKLLGAILLRLDAPDEALKALGPARAQAPEDPQVLLLLGTACLRSGRTEEAAGMLQRAAEIAPEDPRVLGQLALSHIASGRREEAQTALDGTLDLGAGAASIGYTLVFARLRAGEFDAALRSAQDLRERFPDSPLPAHLAGGAQVALGKHAAARESFEAVLAIDPAFHQARANLAALKARDGDLSAAEAEYQQILSVEADHPEALIGLAAVANARGDEAETARWLRRAVQAAPQALKPALALADHYARLGDTAAAVAAIEALSTRRPNDPQVLVALARAQENAGQRDAALRSYERLVRASDDVPAARLLLAQAQLAAGDLPAAQQSYENLKQLQPDNPVVWNNLAWLYQQSGDQRALAHGQRALELAPDQPAIMDTFGWILLDEGQVARAAELLRQAHERIPEAADIAYHYAVALHRNGDSDAARQLLRATLDSDALFSAREEASALLKELGS
jgi:putative PEP-CTERM system TPR-repeat lipoprotein